MVTEMDWGALCSQFAPTDKHSGKMHWTHSTNETDVKQMLGVRYVLLFLSRWNVTCVPALPLLPHINTDQARNPEAHPVGPFVCCFCSDCWAHLDFLAVYLDQSLSEVHPDRGLCFFGELAGTEAVGEAGLTDTWVPDHDDFKDAGSRWREGRARQRAGEFNRRPLLRHITRTGWMSSRESLLQQKSSNLLLLLCDEKSQHKAYARSASASGPEANIYVKSTQQLVVVAGYCQ